MIELLDHTLIEALEVSADILPKSLERPNPIIELLRQAGASALKLTILAEKAGRAVLDGMSSTILEIAPAEQSHGRRSGHHS